jgi:hypothetical protein
MSVARLGYLETAYLSEAPYAGGQATDSRGAQFDVLNTKNKLLRAQFEGFNSVNKNLGAQYLAKITSEDSLGAQFRAFTYGDKAFGTQFNGTNVNGAAGAGLQVAWTPIHAFKAGWYLTEYSYLTTDYLKAAIEKYAGAQFVVKNNTTKYMALQFEGIIKKDQNTGVQFFGKITKDNILGAQFRAMQENKFSAQFRAVIYNTTQLRFLSDFPSRGTSGTNWTATSTATSASNAFNVNNLNTDIVEQVWRSGPGGSQTLRCDTQSGSAGVFVDTFAMLNHNLTQGATILLQASNDNFATTPFNENVIVEPENAYWISPSLPITAYRYWRISIVDVSNTDGFIQIGTIVFGSAVVFNAAENFNDDVKFGLKQFEDKIYTEGFTNVSNDRGQKRYLELGFTDLRSSQSNFKNLRSLFKTHGSLLKVLYIPIPTEPSVFAVFSKLEEIPDESHKQMGDRYVSLTMNMDESL